MNKLCGATAIAIALGFAAPAMAASEAACKAMWSKTDANNSGYISGKEAAIFMSAMIMNGRTTAAADRITAKEFIAACVADVFRNANT